MAKMLGVRGAALVVGAGGVTPPASALGIRVMSMDLLLADDATPLAWQAPSQAEAHTWRGAMEANALREFLADTEWGTLDLLLVDLPPGTDRLATVAGTAAGPRRHRRRDHPLGRLQPGGAQVDHRGAADHGPGAGRDREHGGPVSGRRRRAAGDGQRRTLSRARAVRCRAGRRRRPRRALRHQLRPRHPRRARSWRSPPTCARRSPPPARDRSLLPDVREAPDLRPRRRPPPPSLPALRLDLLRQPGAGVRRRGAGGRARCCWPVGPDRPTRACGICREDFSRRGRIRSERCGVSSAKRSAWAFAALG